MISQVSATYNSKRLILIDSEKKGTQEIKTLALTLSHMLLHFHTHSLAFSFSLCGGICTTGSQYKQIKVNKNKSSRDQGGGLIVCQTWQFARWLSTDAESLTFHSWVLVQ